MDRLLNSGMKYLEEQGLCWPEDRDVTEDHVSCVAGFKAVVAVFFVKARMCLCCNVLWSSSWS
jgi:hypothetical protein